MNPEQLNIFYIIFIIVDAVFIFLLATAVFFLVFLSKIYKRMMTSFNERENPIQYFSSYLELSMLLTDEGS